MPADQTSVSISGISARPIKNGDNRTRTCDPLHVKQMLSQLSYVSMRIF